MKNKTCPNCGTEHDTNVNCPMCNLSVPRYTPGPWKPESGRKMLGNSQFTKWEADVDSKDLLVGTAFGLSMEEAEDNARMFAVAPAFLAALERIVRTDPDSFGDIKRYADWVRSYAKTTISVMKG